MKHSLRKVLLAALLIAPLVNTGCKKDEEAPETRTPTAILQAYNWKLSSYTVDPAIKLADDAQPITDLYATIADCEKDDVSKFNDDGTIFYSYGTNKCSANEPADFNTDRYSFDEPTMTLSTPGSSSARTFRFVKTPMKVTTLSKRTMVVTWQADGDGDGSLNNYTLTYSPM